MVTQRGVSPESTRTPLDILASRGSSVRSTHITVTGYRILRSGATKDPLDSRKAVEQFPRVVIVDREQGVPGRSEQERHHASRGGSYESEPSKTPDADTHRQTRFRRFLLGPPMPLASTLGSRCTAKAVTR